MAIGAPPDAETTIYIDVMISELPAAPAANAGDKLEADQAGITRSITLDQVTTLVAASDQIHDVIDGIIAEIPPPIPVTPGDIALWPFLPLTGGTLSGGLLGTAATFSTVSAGGGGAGLAFASTGGPANPGYFALFRPNGDRLGYIGFNDNKMSYNADAGFFHEFTTGNVSIPGALIGTTATFTTDITTTWLSIDAPDPGWSMFDTDGAADAKGWMTIGGSALSVSAIADDWSIQRQWIYHRDGTTTLPGVAHGVTPAPTATSNELVTAEWALAHGGGGGAATVIGLTPPVSPTAGQLWFCSDGIVGGGQTYLWFDDGTSAQWVPVTPIPASGGGGGSGDFMADGSVPMTGPLVGTSATFSDKVNIANDYQIDGKSVLFETPTGYAAIAAMDGHIGLHVGPVDNFYRATTHHIQNMDGSGEPVLISTTTMTVNVPLAGSTANFTGPLSISGKKAIEFSDPEYVSFGSVRAGMTVGEVGNNYYNASNHFLRSSDTTTTFATINASGTALTGPLTGTTATFTGVTLSGAGSISPAVNNIGTLGASASLRWSNVYSVMGDCSGLLSGANAVFSSTVTATGFNIGSIAVGYLNVPQNLQASTYQTVLADAGKHIYHAVGAAAATWTIPANGTVAYSVGTTLTFVNDSANAITIAITTDTLVWSPGTTTGSRTLGVGGIATALKVTPTRWLLSGTGIT